MEFASYDVFLRGFTVQQEGTWVRRVVDADRPELDFLNVRFCIDTPDAVLGGKWRLLYRGNDATLFENTRVMPRFFTRGNAEIVDLRATGPRGYVMRIAAHAPALIESSVPNGPGWSVRGRRPGPFLSFIVPPGQSVVQVVYQPRSWLISCLIAALAFFTLISGIGIRSAPLSGVPATGVVLW